MDKAFGQSGQVGWNEREAELTRLERHGHARFGGDRLAHDHRAVQGEARELQRDPDGRSKLSELTGMITFPQIVIDGETLGGFQELLAADRAGTLSELLAA